MATFTLNWDNSLVLAEVNAINQRASYRVKTTGGAFITTGFTPSNDMATSVTSATHSGTDNKIYEFKVEAICTAGGPTMNDNGIVEQIVFACVDPSSLTADASTVTISIDLTATDVTKVRFRLRKQGDDSLVQTITTVTPGGIGTTSANFTGLTSNTAYYVTAEFYCVINGVEVISSSSDYLNAVCGGNIANWKITTDAAEVANLIFAWDTEAEAVNLTTNIDGTFSTIDWGDGTINSILTHTYAAPGNYTVRMYSSTATTVNLSSKNLTSFTAVPSTVIEINVDDNDIPALPSLSLNTSLLKLSAESNALTAFPDISTCTLVTEVFLTDNNISGSYNFALNTAMQYLEFGTNGATSISGVANMTSLGQLVMNANGLSVASINTALQALDANGVTSGIFNSVAQTPSAAPTGLGLVAKTNLISKGWTVTTD